MSSFDNVIRLLEQNGKTQKQLADYLGVGQNRITDWKSGRIMSYTKYLPQIAAFLGTTVDAICSDTPHPSSSGFDLQLLSSPLTPAEQTLIESYRTDPAFRAIVDAALDATGHKIKKDASSAS